MCADLCWTIQANFSFTSILDILVVAGIFLVTSFLIRGTQAVPLLRGTLIVTVIVALTATAFPLVAFRWLLSNVITGAFIAIPIIFQPELRRALDRLGRTGLRFSGHHESADKREQVIEGVVLAVTRLSERRHGALIVIERDSSLQEYIDTGVKVKSNLTPQLLLTIFWPKTELHDGAVIIQNDQIAAAACVLPLSSGLNMTDRRMGTRHRAALGISEVSDAICVVVSEETAQISLTVNGSMTRRLDAARLRGLLTNYYGAPQTVQYPWSPLIARVRELFSRTRAA